MGRLLGIAHFLSEQAYSEEKDDTSLIRQTKRIISEESDGNNALKECQVTIAQRMQEHFAGRILRRTGNSLDWNGNALITLLPYEDIPVIVKPTPREMEIITALADNVKER